MTDLPSIPDLLDLEHVEPDLYRSRALYDAPWGMFGAHARVHHGPKAKCPTCICCPSSTHRRGLG